MTSPERFPDPPVSTRALAAVLLVGATIAAFAPVLSAGFVIYDDERYVLRNPHVQEGFTWEALRWAFSTGHASNWHPVTWLAHMLDWRLFGASPGEHHLMSLLLHTASALLLFFLLDRATGAVGRSAFAAALFALHPLRVESVAWIAERKDVLSTLIWFLTTWAYARWARKGGPARYLPVAALLAFGLAAKPMLVTLPLTLLILDFWPLGRWPSGADREGTWRGGGRLLAEKLPLFGLAAASSAVTLAVHSAGHVVGSMQEFPAGVRLGNALVSYVAYLGKTVWPARLAVFYPHPGASLPVWKPVAAALVLAVVTGCAAALRRRHPYLLAGWLWYLVTLLPVIGLVQVGEQAMADRYTYVPLIGVFVAAAWGIPDVARGVLALAARRRGATPAGERVLRWTLGGGAAAVLLTFALLTWAQAATWKDSSTLFQHALAVTRGNHIAHIELGTVLSREGRTEEAIAHYAEAVRLRPDFAEAHFDLAVALHAAGRDAEARKEAEAAARLGLAPPEEFLRRLSGKRGEDPASR